MLTENDAKQKSTRALAFLGDAVYETLVREYITEHSGAGSGELHRMTVSVVCAKSQSEALELLKGLLTLEEEAIVKRGRNSSKSAVPRSAAPKDYRAATALETLFGYLSMTGQNERVRGLFQIISERQIECKIMKARRQTGMVVDADDGQQ